MPDTADTVKKRDRDNLLKMPDDEIIGMVMSGDIATSKKWRDGVNKRNKRYRRHYFQKESVPETEKKKKIKGRSKIWIGVVRAIVDTARVGIAEAIFSVEPNVKIEPTEIDDEVAAEIFESLFRFRASRHQMNLRQILEDDWIFQMCLYDCAVARMGWRVEGRYVPTTIETEEKKVLGIFKRSEKKKETVMPWKRDAVDRPEIEVLDTLLIYPDEHSFDFGGSNPSRFFAYLQDTNISAMKKREKPKDNSGGIYENVKDIEPNSYPGIENVQKTEGKDEWEKTSEADLVQLANYYTPDAMVSIANGKWVVRKQKMSGYPFSKGVYCQPNHQWSGIPLVEGIESLQLDINHLYRMRRDNINFIVNALGIVNKAMFSGIKDQNFERTPGKMLSISFGDPSKAIHYDRPPDTTQALFQDIGFEMRMVERISGVGENRQGAWREGGRRTATEAGLVAEGGDLRLGNIARRIEENNIVDVVNLVYNLEQQHLTEETKYRILGKAGVEFRKITREHFLFKGSFDIIPVGSRYESNRLAKTNQYLQGVQIVGGNQIFMQITNAEEVLKNMWSELGIKDPERFLLNRSKTDYQIPPNMENILLANGHAIQPGNRDNHGEHIPIHQAHMESGKVPLGNEVFFEDHIDLHEQAEEQMKQAGKQMPSGLPTTQANMLGQPFQTAGGMRTPSGSEPSEGGMVSFEGG